MRVTRPVGEGVVTAVDGDPADDLALEAHRPRDRQRDPQRRDRGEAAMSQQTVKANRHPQPGDEVEGHREQDVGEIQAMAPGQPDRHRQPGERHDDKRDRHADPGPALDGAWRPAAHSKRRPAVIIRREPSRHPGCFACAHSRGLPVHRSVHNRLLYFDELMAGLVPDRGRACLAAASRYLAVWLSRPS
jgi:hypothetical protein